MEASNGYMGFGTVNYCDDGLLRGEPWRVGCARGHQDFTSKIMNILLM